MGNLQKPTNNLTEILLTLITKGKASIIDYPYLSGFRTRISELKNEHNLPLNSKNIKEVNKFGNTFTYVEHILDQKHIELAHHIYIQLNKTK